MSVLSLISFSLPVQTVTKTCRFYSSGSLESVLVVTLVHALSSVIELFTLASSLDFFSPALSPHPHSPTPSLVYLCKTSGKTMLPLCLYGGLSSHNSPWPIKSFHLALARSTCPSRSSETCTCMAWPWLRSHLLPRMPTPFGLFFSAWQIHFHPSRLIFNGIFSEILSKETPLSPAK